MLRIISSRDRESLDGLLRGRSQRLAEAERVVAPILASVRERGDDALLEHARRLDGLTGRQVRLDPSAVRTARDGLAEEFVTAAELAAERVRQFARLQMPREWMQENGSGSRLGQIVRPLDSVGAYVPGGRYPLPSTVIMTAVPALEAGVARVAVASPQPAPETVGTAGLLGLNEVYALGGAQAIAAFAFGTESVPKVDRIVGPGNAYVAAAKKLLAGEAGIEFVAGPTELALVFETADPEALAADMLAQAEHDVDATAILLTPSQDLAEAVAERLVRQLQTLPTREVAEASIRANGAAVVTETLEDACEIANRLAPEHLSVSESVPIENIRHAGSVFVGPWSPEAAGDYASGPNHVLPTGGYARLRGGLSVLDFVKIITVQQLSEKELTSIAPAVATLARAEGLEAHARSIEARTGVVHQSRHG